MRESSVTLQEGLHKGLRAEENIRNSEGLVELQNIRVGLAGLEDYEEILQPFSYNPSWNHAKVAKLQQDLLLLDQNYIYTLNSDWSKTLQASDINAELSWHYADFVDYVVLTCGNKIYVRNPSTGAYTLDGSLPSFKTCDNVNGRLVVGNISNFHDCDSTFVAWSRIGDTTFEPDQRQESGYSPAWSGEIYQVKKLGNGFVAYGANGIRVFEISNLYFQQRQIAEFGLASRDAIGGDENSHLLMDDTGALWIVNKEYKLQRLGYKEFFSSWIGDDIYISYNPNPGEFYLSNGSECYLLYKGLSQIYQLVSNISFYNGSKIALVNNNRDKNFYLKTGILDFNLRGFKKIETLEIGADVDRELFVAVEFRSNKQKDWETSDFKQVNHLGNVYVGIEAAEFRLVIRSFSKISINLDYITIRYKVSDKRAIRGRYAG